MVQDNRGLGRSSHGPGEEMPDLAGKNVVGGQPDGIAESPRLQILVDGRIGEGSVAAEVPAEFPVTLPRDDGIEHGLPVLRAMHVPFAEQAAFEVAILIEAE